MEMPKRYSGNQALKVIRGILQAGIVIPTAHLKERMLERDFDMQDVLNVIKNGVILREPELHPKTGKWIYTIEGRTIDGKPLNIPVDIDEAGRRLIILTGMK